jgi:hypothetical protein
LRIPLGEHYEGHKRNRDGTGSVLGFNRLQRPKSGEGDELDKLRKKGWSACKNEMDRRLKSPSTAEYGEPIYNEKAGEIVVTFEVDAQNSFGAMVRSKHRCVARLKQGDMSVVKLEKIER